MSNPHGHGGSGDSHGSGGHGGNASGHVGGGVNRRAALFVAIVASVAAVLFLGFVVLRASPLLLLPVFLLAAALIYLSPRRIEFREYERGVRFRFGKFKDVIGPGWFVIFPSFDRIERVDLREEPIDIPEQKIVTRDNVGITIDTVAYVKVVDPRKAVLEVRDYKRAIEAVINSELRNIVSKMEMEAAMEQTEDISVLLHRRLREVTEQWGVEATRVEVEDLRLPDELVEAMTKRQSAEENKRRIKIESEARQLSITAVSEAASKVSDTALAYLYLDTLQRMGDGRATKILFPMEFTQLAQWFGAKMAAGFESKPPVLGKPGKEGGGSQAI